MARWLLLAASLLATGCGTGGGAQGGNYQPAPYMAPAAKGQAAALAEMRENLGNAFLNGTIQATCSKLKRWPTSQFEVIDEMSVWPVDPAGNPVPLIDLASTPNGGPYPRIQIDTQANHFWEILTIHDRRNTGAVTAMNQWTAQDYKKPFNPNDMRFAYAPEPGTDLASDIMYMARYYFEAHGKYPADPADFLTFCGMGVVTRQEQVMLQNYDVEFLQDLRVPQIAIMLTPKHSGVTGILATCGPTASSKNFGGLPLTETRVMQPGQTHGMQPWKKWSQVKFTRVDLSKIVSTAGFSLPSDTPGSASGSMSGSTGNASPGSD